MELLGNGLIASANFDMRFSKKTDGLGARVGIGYVGGGDAEASILTIPIMLNHLLGKDGNYFEVGAGIVYISGEADFSDFQDSAVAGTLSFMYRKQPIDGGFMWKIGLTPIIASGVFIPYWGGVAIGYAF